MLSIILDIILIILKITGILLLAILGLVVLLTLIILFVPIRYKSIGDFEKDEGFKHQIYAKVTWCLHIVTITFNRIENKNDLVIKVFGINIDKFRRKQRKSKTHKSKKTSKSKKTKLLSKEQKQATDKPKEKKVSKTTSDNADVKTLSQKDKTINKSADTEGDNKEKRSSIIDKLKQKLENILEKIKNICDKIKKYDNVKNSFIEYLRKDESKTAIKEIKIITYKLIKHILPRKLKANIGIK